MNTMTKLFLLLLFFAVICIYPCRVKGESGKLVVVATVHDLGDIAGNVGGDHVTVTSLCTGRRNPHFLQAKPSYIALARKADLWIRVGMDLEVGYEGPILDGSRNSRIRVGNIGHLDASQFIVPLEVPAGEVDRSMGDVHPQGNPHYLLDPFNARAVARAVRDRLSGIDPDNKADYYKKCGIFVRKIDTAMFGKKTVEELGGDRLWEVDNNGELDALLKARELTKELGGWALQRKSLSGVSVVTYHKTWSYFLKRFGMHKAGELEPKPGIPPSPAHLVRITRRSASGGVKVVMLQPFYNKKAADFVSGKTAATTLVCAACSGGKNGPESYIKMMDTLIRRLCAAVQQ